MKLSSLFEGLALGALAMYFMDPDRGRKRRNELRDRASSRLRHLREDVSVMSRDFANRMQGAKRAAQHLVEHDEVTDQVLVERVRAQMGHCISHPGAVMIEATDGHLVLRGDIFTDEVEDAIRCARRVASSKKLDNQLKTHRRGETFPGLQGEGHTADSNGHWTPATSLMACCFGAGLMALGLSRRSLSGGLMAAAGTAMIARGFNEVEHRRESSTAVRTAKRAKHDKPLELTRT